MTTTTPLSPVAKSPEDLFESWLEADRAWGAILAATFPNAHAGDVRYTDAGKGEPGTPLRAAYDEFCRAGSAWHEAKNADLVLIDY